MSDASKFELAKEKVLFSCRDKLGHGSIEFALVETMFNTQANASFHLERLQEKHADLCGRYIDLMDKYTEAMDRLAANAGEKNGRS